MFVNVPTVMESREHPRSWAAYAPVLKRESAEDAHAPVRAVLLQKRVGRGDAKGVHDGNDLVAVWIVLVEGLRRGAPSS